MDIQNFKIWLTNSEKYSIKTVENIISRIQRVNRFKKIDMNEDIDLYLLILSKNGKFKMLSSSVKSQLKKAVKLYYQFNEEYLIIDNCNQKNGKFKILSLFANVGVAEALLRDINIEVVVANELVQRRALLYSEIYPKTKVFCGDITDSEVYGKVIDTSIKNNVDIIMATPPCQGMSTVGQQLKNDERNRLIIPVVQATLDIHPKYVFIENVPMLLKTGINVEGENILILDYLKQKLGDKYTLEYKIINTMNYDVPQSRERVIFLLTRKDVSEKWKFPKKSSHIISMAEAIGDIPEIDPFIKDITLDEMKEIFPEYEIKKKRALSISKWNIPPEHVKRQVIAMMHTPTGKTAFDNKKYIPVKADGTPVKGYKNTYKRQNWDTPAYTITMDNRKISSQNNVHPGRFKGYDSTGEVIYSDPRTLTLYELMRLSTLPDDWNLPEKTSEAFLRRVIGEGIPPLFVKKVFEMITRRNING